MNPELDANQVWIPLRPAAAQTNRPVRELLGLVNNGELAGHVDLVDGRHQLVFRASDLDELGSGS